MDRRTDRETDKEQRFFRTFHGVVVQKIKFGTECNSLGEGENNRKLNPFIKNMVLRSNILYSKIK